MATAHAFFSAKTLSKLASVLSLSAVLSFSFNAQAQENFAGHDAAVAQCEAGNIESCNFLAQNFLNVHQYTEASKYLTTICYSDTPDALRSCAALTSILTEPVFGINNYQQGLKIADYLCSKNGSYGCLLLSDAYFLGTNVSQDLVKASQYAQKACDLKDPLGCRQLAIITFSEAYVLKDTKIAQLSFKYHQDACNLGNKDSCADFAQHNEKLEQFQRFVQSETPQQ